MAAIPDERSLSSSSNLRKYGTTSKNIALNGVVNECDKYVRFRKVNLPRNSPTKVFLERR